jgi:hypothetical protein
MLGRLRRRHTPHTSDDPKARHESSSTSTLAFDVWLRPNAGVPFGQDFCSFGSRWGEFSFAKSKKDKFHLAGDAQFPIHLNHIGRDRSWAQVKEFCNLSFRKPLCQKKSNSLFPFG